MLKQKLELLNKEFTALKTKITQKLQAQDQKITETNQKLETALKDNAENEKVLEQLLKEFQELAQTLE